MIHNTVTLKEMTAKGYLTETASAEDGRVTYLSITEEGAALHRKYDTEYFAVLAPFMEKISDEEAECTIRTIEKFYQVMYERRNSLEKR